MNNPTRWLLSLLLWLTTSLTAWADPVTIAVVLKAMHNEFFELMAEGARQHHAQHGDRYELIIAGVDNETDVAGQQAVIHGLVNRQIDALILVPADSAALLPQLEQVIRHGVLVVNVDNKLDARALVERGLNIPYVGPSNQQGARQVGSYVANRLPKGSEVGLIEGPPENVNAKARSDGFRLALRQTGLREVGIRSGYWAVEGGRAAAIELLKAHPNLRALLCGNDNMAIGAAQGVADLGLTEQVKVAGYDHIPAIKPLLKNGSVVATVDQYPQKQVQVALDLVLSALTQHQSQDELPSLVQTPVKLVTP